MRELFIEEINYGIHGTTLKFSMTPFNVWISIPGSRKMGKAKRPRKVLFPGKYEAAVVIAELKKLPIKDRTIKVDLSIDGILPFKTVQYRNKRLKESALLPMKKEARDIAESVDLS